MKRYDAIVIGLGAMGSAAANHLARRGVRVQGLEQFDIAHDRGSSHGRTRIMRKAYFEHPDYVPLLHRVYDMWAELEAATDTALFHRVGLLLAGPPEGPVVSGVKRAASEHALTIEQLSVDDMQCRFPGFQGDANMEALFEPDAGYLEPESCVRTLAEQASVHGAEVKCGQTVTDWRARHGEVTVTTQDARYQSDSLVICGGAWSSRLLEDLGIPLEVRRKSVFWYAVNDARYRSDEGCPVFGFDTPGGFFYGFPVIDEYGMKAANHTGGEVVDDPSQVDRNSRADEEAEVRAFLDRHLPHAAPRLHGHSVCMYTITPDEHFVVDCHPQHPNVAFAAGFSGHGFKFAPVIGSALADLVCDGVTTESIGFLSARRSTLRGS